MAHAPQSTPTTVRLLSRTWLSGTDAIGPEANPITQKRPKVLVARNAGSLWRPPTGSMTTSTPPSVSSRTRVFRSSRSYATVACAPMPRAASSFSSLDAAADDPGAERHGDVDGGQPDAAARPQHQHPLPLAHSGAPGQREPAPCSSSG